MSGNVIVLTPTGRRQTVKVTPNMTILQIIEEVCKKHGFKPEEYDIKHHKQILDTSSILRFSGLPNNAQLELVAVTRTRSEGEIILGVHLEDGRRLMGSFTPGNTIWEVLTKLCPAESDPKSNPVIVYMRNEIYGLDNFQRTTLRSLGLTNGRAMLRLIHRSPEDLKTQANISAPLPSKPVEEKPYIRQFIPVESSEPPQNSKESQSVSHNCPPVSKNDDSKTNRTSRETSPQLDDDISKKTHPSAKPADMAKLIKQEKQKRNDSCGKSTPKKTSTKTEPVKQEHILEEFVFLGERNAMLFSFETAQAVPSEDLPDDFFDLTLEDAKKLLKDIKKSRFELENGQLLTSNLRNLEESKKQLRALNRYKRAIIRIQFPDRNVLQGTFTPTETIESVMNFIKDYLEDKNMDFYVYSTPPKTVLEKESRLIEIGCVPGALLYFGASKEVKENTFLRKDVLSKMTSSSMASLAATKMRQESTNPNVKLLDDPIEDMDIDDVNVGASTSAAPPILQDYDSKTPSVTPSNVPKWFKPAK